MDFGREPHFGIFPTRDADDLDLSETLELTRLADESALDRVDVQDHPYQPRHLDAWMLLSVLAAHTERVWHFLDVADLPLRPPAVLLKAAASPDT